MERIQLTFSLMTAFQFSLSLNFKMNSCFDLLINHELKIDLNTIDLKQSQGLVIKVLQRVPFISDSIYQNKTNFYQKGIKDVVLPHLLSLFYSFSCV